MGGVRRTRTKVCCISSVEGARLAAVHGADALGLVSSMPSGPGVIDEDLVAEIAAAAPPGVARGPESVKAAGAVAGFVDSILLDSGKPNLPGKELGSAGHTHDWRRSRAIVEQNSAPVYLAGGLNAENVGQAIHETSPFDVDLRAGVRRGGRLTEAKPRKFAGAVTQVAA